MNSLRIGVAATALIAVATLGASPVSAHTRSMSYSSWQFDGNRARVTLRMALLEITRLSPNVASAPTHDPRLSAYWVESLQLLAAGEVCAPVDEPRALRAPSGKAAFEWRLDCGEHRPDEIRTSLFLDVAPGHLHFARLRAADSALLEHVLSGLDRSWLFDGGESDAGDAIGTSFRAYVVLGMEHIATGYDHLVFLLVLLLMSSRLREVATIVTGFTIAHSITLSLAVLGGLRPESHAVEALIGLSIALVAAENAWLQAGHPRTVPVGVGLALLAMTALAGFGYGALPATIPLGLGVFSLCYFAVLSRVERPTRLRIAIAFVFGLVHGFGFAGVLEEIALPVERMTQALFGFNLGVEIGQLIVVAMLWPALQGFSRLRNGRPHRLFVESATAAACAMGVFWLVSRAYAIS